MKRINSIIALTLCINLSTPTAMYAAEAPLSYANFLSHAWAEKFDAHKTIFFASIAAAASLLIFLGGTFYYKQKILDAEKEKIQQQAKQKLEEETKKLDKINTQMQQMHTQQEQQNAELERIRLNKEKEEQQETKKRNDTNNEITQRSQQEYKKKQQQNRINTRTHEDSNKNANNEQQKTKKRTERNQAIEHNRKQEQIKQQKEIDDSGIMNELIQIPKDLQEIKASELSTINKKDRDLSGIEGLIYLLFYSLNTSDPNISLKFNKTYTNNTNNYNIALEQCKIKRLEKEKLQKQQDVQKQEYEKDPQQSVEILMHNIYDALQNDTEESDHLFNDIKNNYILTLDLSTKITVQQISNDSTNAPLLAYAKFFELLITQHNTHQILWELPSAQQPLNIQMQLEALCTHNSLIVCTPEKIAFALKPLLAKGLNLNAPCNYSDQKNGHTPLILSLQAHNKSMVQFLLDKNVTIDTCEPLKLFVNTWILQPIMLRRENSVSLPRITENLNLLKQLCSQAPIIQKNDIDNEEKTALSIFLNKHNGDINKEEQKNYANNPEKGYYTEVRDILSSQAKLQ